ncbi:hypothetical protein DPEC_G00210800 [Dallia pectoralis]|uniref:Uncharacterized protein n=1 Tax=Dallia pectoralis TaxID=75939 RepID=A0ACC2G5Y4_DALPE|nr:hypothetical protein DPEC_G00210800 [Dallia pectoralis]
MDTTERRAKKQLIQKTAGTPPEIQPCRNLILWSGSDTQEARGFREGTLLMKRLLAINFSSDDITTRPFIGPWDMPANRTSYLREQFG